MKPTTISLLQKCKQEKKRFATITAYDYSFAKLFADEGINVMLVGDSLGMTIQGHDSTLPVTVEDIAYHTRAVRRGAPNCLLLECVPVELAKRVTEALSIPVIGIGAGNVTDGQILVMHDAFGITGGHIPKFAKNFLAEAGDMRAAVQQYMAEVESGVYPGEEHSFH
ncbi:hypothetical protein SI51_18675 [Salmonella enterica subsp. enterica]|nr:hypothetical protein [Salmonella enterica subsp. enterica serovar Cerro]